VDIRTVEPRIRALMGMVGLQGKWDFKWCRQEGICGQADFIDRTILLSRAYTRVNNEAIFLDTIYHLFSHALSDREGHNREWRAEAIELGVAIDSNSLYYQKLLQQEVIPDTWPTVEPRHELWIYSNCLAPIRRRHAVSVAIR
jgi:hypothetical protein